MQKPNWGPNQLSDRENQLFNGLMTRTLREDQKENYDYHNLKYSQIKGHKTYDPLDQYSNNPTPNNQPIQNIVYTTPNQTQKVVNQQQPQPSQQSNWSYCDLHFSGSDYQELQIDQDLSLKDRLDSIFRQKEEHQQQLDGDFKLQLFRMQSEGGRGLGLFENPDTQFHTNQIHQLAQFHENSMKSISSVSSQKKKRFEKIRPKELVSLINDKWLQERTIILDCRFDYEYQGGHIVGSVNIDNPQLISSVLINNQDLIGKAYLNFIKQLYNQISTASNQPDLRSLFFQFCQSQNIDQQQINQDIVLILHCEFSKERSRKMVKFIQKNDVCQRFKYIYLLEGGYERFVSEYGHLCVPQNGYISMFNKKLESLKSIKQQTYQTNWQKIKSIRKYFSISK